MSHLSGNAWAIKARERARQLQEGDFKDTDSEPFPPVPEAVLRPGSSRKSSGLDYDQELALPMPKPRHLPLPEIEVPGNKTSVLGRGIITKKRSTTEPPRPGEIVDALKAEEKDKDKENKKSKIAALKSKFSLKDLGKDFRKDSHALPPLSSMPSMPVPKDTFAPEEKVSAAPDNPVNEKRHPHVSMTPRQHGLHPLSAPPFQTTSPFLPHTRSKIKAPEDLETNIHSANKGKSPVRDASYFDESPILGKADLMQHVEAVLLDGSSPPARTGEYFNAGHVEFVHNDQRISSMQADDHHDPPNTPVSASSPSAVSIPVSLTVSHSSSNDVKPPSPVIEKKHPLIVSSQQDTGSPKTENKKQYPFIVSSDQVKHNYPHSYEQSSYPEPHSQYPFASSTFNPVQYAPYDTQYSYNNGVYDPYSGMTSHGGCAPPPPQQGYQNTMTLDQQVASQVEAIHHHLDTALNRVGRALENNTNWSSDQILKSIESMFDVLRMLNLRHTEAIKEMNRLLADVRVQMTGVVHQTRQLEDRVLTMFPTEVAKVRADISALGSRMGVPPYHAHPNPHPNPQIQPYPGMGFGSAGFSGTAVGVDVFGNHCEKNLNYKKPRKEKDGEVEDGKKVDDEHNGAGDKEKDVSGEGEGEGLSCATDLHKRAEPVQTSVTPLTTTASVAVSAKDDVFTQSLHPRTILKNPARVSSGSPEPKSSALKTTVAVSGNGSSKSLKGDSEDKSSTDSGRNGQKRGIWNMGRPREDDSNGNKTDTSNKKSTGSRFTRRSKNNSDSSHSKTPSKQRLPPSTPQSRSAPSTPQSHGSRLHVANSVEESPSAIHPALRNARQQQIMAERAAAGSVSAYSTSMTNTQNAAIASTHRQEMRRPVIQVNLPVTAPYHYPGVTYSTMPMALPLSMPMSMPMSASLPMSMSMPMSPSIPMSVSMPMSMSMPMRVPVPLPVMYQAAPRETQSHSQMPSFMRASEAFQVSPPLAHSHAHAQAYYAGAVTAATTSGIAVPTVTGENVLSLPPGLPPVPRYAPPPVPVIAPRVGGNADVHVKNESQD